MYDTNKFYFQDGTTLVWERDEITTLDWANDPTSKVRSDFRTGTTLASDGVNLLEPNWRHWLIPENLETKMRQTWTDEKRATNTSKLGEDSTTTITSAAQQKDAKICPQNQILRKTYYNSIAIV